MNLFLIIKLKCSENFLDISTVESSEDELTTVVEQPEIVFKLRIEQVVSKLCHMTVY